MSEDETISEEPDKPESEKGAEPSAEKPAEASAAKAGVDQAREPKSVTLPDPDPKLPSANVALARRLSTEDEEIGELIGIDVVLDTRGEIIYIGRLAKIGEHFYLLENADVHDVVAGRTSKEIYILESAKYGVKKNRHKVHVRKNEVVSLSALSDIIEY